MPPNPSRTNTLFQGVFLRGRKHQTNSAWEKLVTLLAPLCGQVRVRMVQEPALIIKQRTGTAPERLLSTVSPCSFDALNSAGLPSAKGANTSDVKFPVFKA